MMVRKFASCLIALVMAAGFVSVSSCSHADFNRIPKTSGFFQHLEKSKYESTPMVAYWDDMDDAEWDARVHGTNGKSQTIILKPVTLDYFTPRPKDAALATRIENMRDYFDKELQKEFQRLDKDPNNNLHLVTKPGRGVYTLEVAMLSVKSTNVAKNVAMQVPGFFIKGGSAAASLVLGQKDDTGYISFGARLIDDRGKVICETGDFEYGMQSVIGSLGFDSKDYRPYAYQKQTIDFWVEEIGQLMTTDSKTPVSKPTVSFNPF